MARILVVDDERSVLWLLQHQLDAGGHESVAAPSADEAERIFRQSPGSFDLLITDVVMPRRSGIDLARQLLEIEPALPVLFISGFTSEVWIPSRPDCVYALLSKPFREGELVKTLEDLLRRASRGKASAAGDS